MRAAVAEDRSAAVAIHHGQQHADWAGGPDDPHRHAGGDVEVLEVGMRRRDGGVALELWNAA